MISWVVGQTWINVILRIRDIEIIIENQQNSVESKIYRNRCLQYRACSGGRGGGRLEVATISLSSKFVSSIFIPTA